MKLDLMVSILGRLDAGQIDRLRAALVDFRGAVRAEALEHPDQFDLEHEHNHPHQPQGPAHRAQEKEFATR
jgi:hypothetical protein